ncbi:MAG: ankyrin repeat domain-containing protein [Longimicrobiales bacterium]
MHTSQRLSAILLFCVASVLGAASPPPPDSPVADAAMRGDREGVRALLHQGADVNAAQGDGMTALHWAATHGDDDLARMLLYAGATLDAATRNGNYTALHLAARAGSAPVVRVLLDAGADVGTATTSGGATALHFAAAQGDAEVIAALIEHGADVDVRESAWGQTPLMWAAAYDRLEALETLIAHNADIALASNVEDVPSLEREARAAARARNRRMAALRAADSTAEAETGAEPGRGRGEGGEPAATTRPDSTRPAERAEGNERRDPDRTAPPDSAAEAGAEPSREAASRDSPTRRTGDDEPRALSYGELVGNKGGLTPLLFAARQGNVESAVALLETGADIDKVSDGDHTSPLLMATINGHFDLAMLLLERGADPHLASDAGATPLYAALNVQWSAKSLYPQPTAYQQQKATYLELMGALLKAGADPNVRLKKHLWYMSYNFDLLRVNTTGATPFWRAAYGTDVGAMRLLMRHGADPTLPTLKTAGRQRGDDAPAEGDEEGDDPSGLPPIPPGGPGVYAIHAASGVGYGEGYAANAHRHAPDGWLPTIRYLVEELGADVNARDHNGYTALHHAGARGDNELILYLIEKRADITVVSRRGQTAADMANGPVQRVSPFPATVALLEELGSKNNHNCRSC